MTVTMESGLTIAKGISSKCLDTAAGGEDASALQWQVITKGIEGGLPALTELVEEADTKLSKAGYKTIAVAARSDDKAPFEFLGLLPMIDPPRFDTKRTIANLNRAGVDVKMCTGDHQNIAIETARLIGLNQDIRAGEEIRGGAGPETTAEMIKEAGGFAQVLPRDKREVVLTLRNKFKAVVGMTGDGVNDAPALSSAQVGIAVDGATDAAKGAAAIILTTPGLSAIFGGLVESRKIFARLKSYIQSPRPSGVALLRPSRGRRQRSGSGKNHRTTSPAGTASRRRSTSSSSSRSCRWATTASSRRSTSFSWRSSTT